MAESAERPSHYVDGKGKDTIDRLMETWEASGLGALGAALRLHGYYLVSEDKYRDRAGAKGDYAGDAAKQRHCARCGDALGNAIRRNTVSWQWLRSNAWRS